MIVVTKIVKVHSNRDHDSPPESSLLAIPHFITARKLRCLKVMFSQASVCPRGLPNLDAAPPPPARRQTPGRTPFQDRVNRRVVRILVECILV